MRKLLFVVTFLPFIVLAQSKKQKKALEAQRKVELQTITAMQNHVASLTDSKLSPANYIAEQLTNAGLAPVTGSYIHEFKVKVGKQIDPATGLKINEKEAILYDDYFPLSYSASKKVTGMPAMALRERGVPWFVDLKSFIDNKDNVKEFDLHKLIQKETVRAAAKGATALFVYNTTGSADSISFDAKDETSPMVIPVVYVTGKGLKDFFKDHSDMLDIEVNVALADKYKTGQNVLAMIDNKAANNVVILSYYPASGVAVNDVSGNSMYSGNTAFSLELAKALTASKAKNNNYVFLFADADKEVNAVRAIDKTISNAANYVVNLANVTFSDSAKRAIISNYQSASGLQEVFHNINYPQIETQLQPGITTDGIDQFFFERNIPIVTFSTGAESIPTVNALNREKQLHMLKYLTAFIETADAKGKYAFVSSAIPKTQGLKVEEKSEPAVSEKQSVPVPSANTVANLGVIPAQLPNKQGIQIKVVAPKKIGAKIGLLPGDVLTSIGTYNITDMKSYLSALSQFKAGEKTVVKIKRGNNQKQFDVVF